MIAIVDGSKVRAVKLDTVHKHNVSVAVLAVSDRSLGSTAVLCCKGDVVKCTVVTCLEGDLDGAILCFLQLTYSIASLFEGCKRLFERTGV